MELLRLLQIDSSLIGPEARESLLVADRVWHPEGCPRETCALIAALEKILRRRPSPRQTRCGVQS
jgi:hypothetical protein